MAAVSLGAVPSLRLSVDHRRRKPRVSDLGSKRDVAFGKVIPGYHATNLKLSQGLGMSAIESLQACNGFRAQGSHGTCSMYVSCISFGSFVEMLSI